MNHQCVIEWTRGQHSPFRAVCRCGWMSPALLHSDDAGMYATRHCRTENEKGTT